jgi:phenylalanyl-tRNA synthetase beta chain
MIGMAREAGAVFKKDLKMPDLSDPGEPGLKTEIECVVEKEDLCPEYTCRSITGVKVAGAPARIRKYLTSLGLRPVNNIVDVTNFCLMETGQPLHAFDLDKIKGGRIVVREARNGEKITTIDNVERELEAGMLVIADEERPVAIAGVIGGKETEVTERTKNVLLESAYFQPADIRRTARKLGISTDSSYRFERGVDKGMISGASARAASLMKEYAGGRIAEILSAGGLEPLRREIVLEMDYAERLLGIKLKEEDTADILSRLGMEIKKTSGKTFKVIPPSYREDIKQEVDVIEEVARINGYDKIPAKVEKLSPEIERKSHSRLVEEKTVSFLAGKGLDQIMSYSLISSEAAGILPGADEKAVKLFNPLSEEHAVLTPHLVDGMLKTVAWNINRSKKDLALFEKGKRYILSDRGEGYSEIPVLCVSLTGALNRNWKEGERRAGFYDLKGIMESYLEVLGMEYRFIPAEKKGFINCAEVRLGNGAEPHGFIAQAGPSLKRKYGIEQEVFICHLDLDLIFSGAVLSPKMEPLPKFPFSSRDISLICASDDSVGEIIRYIRSVPEEIFQDVHVTAVYEGDPIPEGKRSVSFTLEYGDPEKTLKDEQIETAHTSICKGIEERFDIDFR